VIGIAGPSCSGKTTLARRLAAGLPGGGLVFELDWYYHDQAGVSVDAINVDIPTAIDHRLAITQLRRLIDGQAIERPAYDYATHTRRPQGVMVRPAANIIVEGLFALYWPEVGELLDYAIFIRADHDICLKRRIERDTRERGRTADEVARQFHDKVEPMYEKHVHPTWEHAGLILDGAQSIDDLVGHVEDWLQLDDDPDPSLC
jgi:uridine kinase